MTPEDQELVDFLESISFQDDADQDWQDRPDLGVDPDEVEDEDEEDDE